MLTVFIQVFCNLFEISVFMIAIEIGHLAYLEAVGLLNQKKCYVAIAYGAKSKFSTLWSICMRTILLLA